MTRLEANRKILKTLSLIVEQETDWRFHQILQNIGLTPLKRSETGSPIGVPDLFYEESTETLKRLDEFLNMDEVEKLITEAETQEPPF